MIRQDLIEALTKVRPALAGGGSRLPLLNHLWFRGDRLMTCNEEIAISVPCKAGFTAAIPPTLIDIVAPHTQKEVTLTLGDRLDIKVGNTTAHLGIFGNEFFFDMPKLKKPFPAPINELIGAIKLCLKSIGYDVANEQTTGVTLMAEGGTLKLYATDRRTLTYCRVPLTAEPDVQLPVVLSAPFCQQLCAMEGDIKLEIHPKYALASSDQGMLLYGRLIEIKESMNFDKILDAHLPKDYQKTLVEVTPKLKARLALALKLTSAVAAKNFDYPSTKVTCQKQWMHFLTRTDLGELKDKVEVKGHPDVQVTLTCALIEAGLEPCNKMLATERCMIMSNGKGVYLVSGRSA